MWVTEASLVPHSMMIFSPKLGSLDSVCMLLSQQVVAYLRGLGRKRLASKTISALELLVGHPLSWFFIAELLNLLS